MCFPWAVTDMILTVNIMMRLHTTHHPKTIQLSCFFAVLEIGKMSSDKGEAIRKAASASRIYQVCLMILGVSLSISILFMM